MRSIVFLLAVGPCLWAQQQGSIEGTAINAITREPLANVHIRLIAAGFTGISGAYGAMSDRAGHFSIATIRPGTYILLPERTGFLHVQNKAGTTIPTVAIKGGEHVTGYELEMTPRAVVSGRVVDESGDPVQGVRVQTIAVSTESAPVILFGAAASMTDDRGEFRIAGAPGKYYVQATPASNSNDRPEVRSDGTTEAVYGTTYYPSAPRKDRATVAEAIAGKDVGGLEIRLARQQQGLSISGVVSGMPEGLSRAYVLMQFGEKAPTVNSARNVSASADGKFKFESLQPGFYRVTAQYSDGKNMLVSRTMEWTLENTDISNVELRLLPGLEISGKVRTDGPAGTPAPKGTLRFEPVLGYNIGTVQRSGGELDEEGSFRIRGVVPIRYRVKLEPLPEGAYLKTLEIDGTVSGTDTVDLSSAVKNVTANVVIGRNGPVLSGHILDVNGERMMTNVVMIFLARDFTEMTGLGNGTTQANPDGTYTLKGATPGKYKILAIDALRLRGGSALMDGMKEMFNRAEEIELKEGDKITKDLKVTIMEDPDAKKK